MKKTLKEAAKKGDKDVCMILAKEVVNSRKAINKIHASKAHINSVSMQMKNQQGRNNCKFLSTLGLMCVLTAVLNY